MIMMMQLLGYVSKARGILGEHAQSGLAGYVYNVGLPAVLFQSVATLDLDEMAIQIVCGVLLAKVVLVCLARGLAHLLTRSDDGTGAADTLGGLAALLCTMSDDLGVGVPLFSAFFPSNSHAVSHLFVLSALQSIVINPIAFVFLGVGRASSGADMHESAAPPSRLQIWRDVILNLRNNPLVLAAVAGTAYNRISAGGELPWCVSSVTGMAGQAFTPLVLFIAGLGTRGSLGSLTSLQHVVMPVTLVVLKSIILPIVAYFCVALLGGDSQACDYGFAYGLLPCANSIFAIGRSYKVDAALSLRLAASLFLGKIVSFTLILLLAVSQLGSNWGPVSAGVDP